jgi:hypothetical protein
MGQFPIIHLVLDDKSVHSSNLPAVLAGSGSAEAAKYRTGQALAARVPELLLTPFAESA